jgi:hypothetical protein
MFRAAAEHGWFVVQNLVAEAHFAVEIEDASGHQIDFTGGQRGKLAVCRCLE